MVKKDSVFYTSIIIVCLAASQLVSLVPESAYKLHTVSAKMLIVIYNNLGLGLVHT